MTSFLVICSFFLGFIIGIIEKKTNDIKIKLPKSKPIGEVLITPSEEVLEKEEAKTFYASMR